MAAPKTSIPTTVEQLMVAMAKQGIGPDDLKAFEEHMDENEYDIETIQTDMADAEDSMLRDWCRDSDSLSVGITAFHIVKAIVNGEEYAATDPLTVSEMKQVRLHIILMTHF